MRNSSPILSTTLFFAVFLSVVVHSVFWKLTTPNVLWFSAFFVRALYLTLLLCVGTALLFVVFPLTFFFALLAPPWVLPTVLLAVIIVHQKLRERHG